MVGTPAANRGGGVTDGMKLSIRDKIVGLLLQDMDFMVKTVIAIEREVDDVQSIWMQATKIRGRRANLLLLV